MGTRPALLVLLLSACAEEPSIFTEEEEAALAALSPEVLPSPPPDASNAWADDARAAAFGQSLFFDTSMSGELLDGDNDGGPPTLGTRGEVQRVSCAGCHVPEDGFSDTRSPSAQLSLATGWGIRKTPSLLDLGHSALIMWDGRHDSLYGQVFGPIESAVEMNSSRLFAAQQVFARHRAEYEAIFGPMPPLDDAARFPPLSATETGCRALEPRTNVCTTPMRGAPGDGAEYDGMAPEDQIAVTRVIVNVGKAIGAYERRLSCGPSRFDAFMRGDPSALTGAEQRGAALFVGRADCVRCHSGPFLSDERFHNVGLAPQIASVVFIDAGDRGAIVGIASLAADPLNTRSEFSDGDDGRVPDAIDPALEGAFRTPRLRCVSSRPSFMHTAHMRSLREVIQFFSRGGDRFGYPGTSEIAPLDLTIEEQEDLLAFLDTLDGPGPDVALLTEP